MSTVTGRVGRIVSGQTHCSLCPSTRARKSARVQARKKKMMTMTMTTITNMIITKTMTTMTKMTIDFNVNGLRALILM